MAKCKQLISLPFEGLKRCHVTEIKCLQYTHHIDQVVHNKSSLYRRTLFVSSEDPEPDASIQQLCNGMRDSILELVINGRSTKQLHVLLQLSIKLVQLTVTVLQ